MFWNWLALVCLLFDSCSPNSAYRQKDGSSGAVDFTGTIITMTSSDATSHQIEAKEDAMLDDLLNSQMAVINQSMPPPVKKFLSKWRNKIVGKKPAMESPPLEAEETCEEDSHLLDLALNMNWTVAYIEGTCTLAHTVTLSGHPALISSLNQCEQAAIGMYTASGIFQEVNAYMKQAEKNNQYMNTYIRIVTNALMKIQPVQPGSSYPSQEKNKPPVRALYRGFSKSRIDWTQENVQYRIESFWSTSESRAKAEHFLFGPGPGEEYTLLEITGGLQFSRPIAAFSCRPDELEFLFLPGPTFHAQRKRSEEVTKGGKTVTINVVSGVVKA